MKSEGKNKRDQTFAFEFILKKTGDDEHIKKCGRRIGWHNRYNANAHHRLFSWRKRWNNFALPVQQHSLAIFEF
jgi:hypothetical protein